MDHAPDTNRAKLVARQAKEKSLVRDVQTGLSWAAVAARNGDPVGSKIDMADCQLPPTPKTHTNAPVQHSQTKKEFRPLDAVLKPDRGSLKTEEEKRTKGFSETYRGNIDNPNNESADIAEADNCSVFITGLPQNTTVKHLLDAITAIGPFGKVFQTSMMKAGQIHRHRAARITMWNRAGAVRLLSAIQAGKLVLSDQTTQAVWDKIRARAQTGASYLSRVLFISGPLKIVDANKLYDFLNKTLSTRRNG